MIILEFVAVLQLLQVDTVVVSLDFDVSLCFQLCDVTYSFRKIIINIVNKKQYKYR
jgi:hypothetical protein